MEYAELKAKYGVCFASISNICNGKTWAWLTGHGK